MYQQISSTLRVADFEQRIVGKNRTRIANLTTPFAVTWGAIEDDADHLIFGVAGLEFIDQMRIVVFANDDPFDLCRRFDLLITQKLSASQGFLQGLDWTGGEQFTAPTATDLLVLSPWRAR